MAQSGKINYQKAFEIKSGKVEYKIDGETKGTKTLWWDDYGRQQYPGRESPKPQG
jgi:hypothetical protein